MNAGMYAARLGLTRGWAEFRHSLASGQDMAWTIAVNVAFIVVLVLQRDSRIHGTSLALLTLPSLLGMLVAQVGIMTVAGMLATHREDGTLLRAKAVPDGMRGYLVAQIVLAALFAVFNIAVILTAGLIVLDTWAAVGVGGWLTLGWVMGLGLLATLPWGAIIGSVVQSAESSFGLTFLPVAGLVAISGIFYPISALPGWVQAIAQVFPIYWLGLGMRSALLPGSAAAAEIAGHWRHLETAGVLTAWAVVGLLIAPSILRRMARQESGSTMEHRRERALRRRGY